MADKQSDELTLGGVSRKVGIDRGTAYLWALSGKLPARFVAGRYLVRRSDLGSRSFKNAMEQLRARREARRAR